MPIDYQTRRKKWQAMLDRFPAALKPVIAYRNVEAVAALPKEDIETLAAAVEAGLRNIPEALRTLKENPGMPLETLLEKRQKEKPHEDTDYLLPINVSPEMVSLIQHCYTNMPHLAAEALACSPAMLPLAAAAQSHEQILASSLPDFVVVVYRAFLQECLAEIVNIIDSNPAFQQAIRQSGLPGELPGKLKEK
jgi:hypothetical protein